MRKTVIRSTLIVLVLVVALLGPAILSWFSSEEETIRFTAVDSGKSDKIDAYPAFDSVNAFVEEMTSVSENDAYSLYVHERLAAVALYDKNQGNWVLSNPYDVETSGDTQEELNKRRSQVWLTYYDEDGRLLEMNSFSDCVAKHQFVMEPVERGVEVHMTLGQVEEPYLLPELMSAAMMAKLTGKLDEYTSADMVAAYRHITLEGITQELGENLKKRYPYLVHEDLYELLTLSTKEKRSLSQALEETGLTREVIREEYAKVGYETSDQLPAFTLTVRYQLEEDGLHVVMPLDAVSYRSQYYEVGDITLLPYFGCGTTADETGSLFVPDGSGAVIEYNTKGSKRLTGLTLPVYGIDNAFVSDATDFSTVKTARLPVFGNTGRQGAFIGVIESGESVCSIRAESGSGSEPYPTVYATVTYRYSETFYYDDKDFGHDVVTHATHYNKGEFTVRYLPVKQGGTYADMAFAYKAYLTGKGVLQLSETQPQLLLQLLGWVKNSDGSYALTTFRDAADILDELHAEGIDQVMLRYLGWADGGLNNRYIRMVSAPGFLGGTAGWDVLTKTAAQYGDSLYMDMDLAYVCSVGFADGFSPGRDACRTLRNKLTGLYAYNYGDSAINRSQLLYGVSAAKLQGDVSTLVSRFAAKLPGAAVSVGTLGTALNSTFRKGSVMTRPEAQAVQAQSLATLAVGGRLLLEDANVYTLAYCGVLANLSVSSSGYAATDYDVPFYQLAVSGCLNYSARPLNESENTRQQLLKAIETGADISYITAYRNQSQLKTSSASRFFSVDYSTLVEEMTATWKEYTAAAESIGSRIITGHERLADGVYRTTFDNGSTVTVNYGSTVYDSDGPAVSPEGYLVQQGGGDV
ncbi:MAG: DUF5696 domain-containing protein [Oscillospiraceae bacterium]|nr:DUF5696 domain-containing protein [Oscillospiraceae bacterium]